MGEVKLEKDMHGEVVRGCELRCIICKLCKMKEGRRCSDRVNRRCVCDYEPPLVEPALAL